MQYHDPHSWPDPHVHSHHHHDHSIDCHDHIYPHLDQPGLMGGGVYGGDASSIANSGGMGSNGCGVGGNKKNSCWRRCLEKIAKILGFPLASLMSILDGDTFEATFAGCGADTGSTSNVFSNLKDYIDRRACTAYRNALADAKDYCDEKYEDNGNAQAFKKIKVNWVEEYCQDQANGGGCAAYYANGIVMVTFTSATESIPQQTTKVKVGQIVDPLYYPVDDFNNAIAAYTHDDPNPNGENTAHVGFFNIRADGSIYLNPGGHYGWDFSGYFLYICMASDYASE